MNITNKTLPTIEEFKEQAKELKRTDKYEKLGYAQNALAQKYGYKDYRAIKSVLKSNLPEPIVISSDEFKQFLKEQIFFSSQYSNSTFDEKYYFKNQKNIVEGICIDPLLPDGFWGTVHEERSEVEILEWWNMPFICTEKFNLESYEEFYERMSSHSYTVESEEEYCARKEIEEQEWNEAWTGGIRYDVYILDGGVWDSPTSKAKVGSLKEALDVAKSLKLFYEKRKTNFSGKIVEVE